MKNFIFVIIFAWSCLLAMTHAQCTFYTLKSGQTFASLSNGNSALFNLLVSNNPPVNGNYAYSPGSTICIPSASYSSFNFDTSSNTASCTFYTIRSGDSFYSLSNGNSALISALVNIKGLNLWLLKPDYFLNPNFRFKSNLNPDFRFRNPVSIRISNLEIRIEIQVLDFKSSINPDSEFQIRIKTGFRI
jgi:hypothetical protein